MLSELFYWIFNMSISATIAGVIVLLLKKMRKIPCRIVYALWLIPLFRMWIPIGMSSKYSLMSLISKFMARTVTVYEGGLEFSMTNFAMAADQYFPVTYKTPLLRTIFYIASIVWIIIAAALLIAMFLVYMLTKSELHDARHFRDRIYISDKVTTPAVYGMIHEKIILPKEYESDDLKFILLHEETHIKRKDNLWRMVGIVTACIHWFNPMSWVFLKSFLASMELACDEAVIRKCGERERKAYATTLLNCAESKSVYASAFGGAKVRVRIDRILSYRKLSALSVIYLVILSAVIGYVLLTNAM